MVRERANTVSTHEWNLLNQAVEEKLGELIEVSQGGTGVPSIRNGDPAPLTGEWRTIFTTLPLLNQQCTIGELMTARKSPIEEHAHSLTVDSVRQIIRCPSGSNLKQISYDNVVEFSYDTGDGNRIPGTLLTKGFADISPTDPCTLDVVFYAQHCCCRDDKDEEVFTRLSGLPTPHHIAQQIKSKSTVAYLDDDLRIMKGGRGNLYILEKIWGS